MQLRKEKRGSAWVNGGNYVLVAPKTCDDVAASSVTIAVSDRPCEASTQADFQSLTYNTYFKGDFGFHLGQCKHVQCLRAAIFEVPARFKPSHGCHQTRLLVTEF